PRRRGAAPGRPPGPGGRGGAVADAAGAGRRRPRAGAGRDPGPGQRRPGAAGRGRRAHARRRPGRNPGRRARPGRAARRLPAGPPTELRRSLPMKPAPTGALLLPLLLLAGCASAPKSADTGPEPAPLVAGTAAVAAAGEPTDPATAAQPAPEAGAGALAPAQEGAEVAAVPADPVDPVAPAATDTDALAPTEAEDDFAALYGAPADGDPSARPAYDPWEPMNRRIHAFNNVVDRAIARPVARAYVAVVPEPVRLGVGNFFDNLASPVIFLNQLLQGRPRDAVQTLGRFVVNTTLGIGGIFDPATDLKMKRRSEDFGQT